MRLFLLPISSRKSLIYCQRIQQQAKADQSYIDKITTRASAKWITWEKAESGWKKTVTSYGNKLFQRLPYEEWGLKSIPPRSAKGTGNPQTVYVEYPSSIIEQDAAQKALWNYAAEGRQGFHKRRMWASLIGMPITAPLAMIPIVPNIPFFYLCFRAWSHWRAQSGSSHLNHLLKSHLINLSPSKALDEIYALQKLNASLSALESELKTATNPNDRNNPTNTTTISSPPSSKTEKTSPDETPSLPPKETETETETMLLAPSSGTLIADCLEIPELEQEIERAIHQVGRALTDGKEKKEKEEEEQEKSTTTKTTTTTTTTTTTKSVPKPESESESESKNPDNRI